MGEQLRASSPSDKDKGQSCREEMKTRIFLFYCNMVNDTASDKTDERAKQAPLASTNSSHELVAYTVQGNRDGECNGPDLYYKSYGYQSEMRAVAMQVVARRSRTP